MPIATEHVLHGIVNDSTFISQIESSRPSPGIQNLLTAFAAGHTQPLFVGNHGQKPVVPFESTAIKQILDLTGITIADLSGANTDLLFKKATHLGSRVAPATEEHTRIRMAEAGLECLRITAGDKQVATASCRIFASFDGSNEPMVPAGSVALAGTPAAANFWKLGPIYINGSLLPGGQQVTIDFGRAMFELGSDGELYCTFFGEQAITPVITVSGHNVPWTTIGLNGLAITSLSVYLRKMGTTAPVANGTASHIKFAATAGLATIDDTSAGGNDPAMTGLRLSLAAADSSTAIMTINTAIAITT